MEDPLRDCMGFRLGAAWRRLDRLANRTYESMGLSHAHAQILLCVLEKAPLRMADIVALTGFAQPTVSRLTAELARHRYLRRTPDKSDRRAQLISPGKRALAQRVELVQLQEKLDAAVRRTLAEEDFDALRRLLDRVAPGD